MFTLILTLIISQPSCSGPNCIGYSVIRLSRPSRASSRLDSVTKPDRNGYKQSCRASNRTVPSMFACSLGNQTLGTSLPSNNRWRGP